MIGMLIPQMSAMASKELSAQKTDEEVDFSLDGLVKECILLCVGWSVGRTETW